MKKKLAIFDLDGTLLNTIADLAQSTNYALAACGFPTHEVKEYNFFVGRGIYTLFELSLPENERNEENVMRIRDLFIPHYDKHKTDLSGPYAGIADLLNYLQKEGIMLSIASNKYQVATESLVKHNFPDIHFTAVLGQREEVPMKPDPTIVNEILSIAQVSKEETIYIGDSGVDMQTAKNAGVTAVGVSWGFRPREELSAFNPEYIVDEPKEIKDIILN